MTDQYTPTTEDVRKAWEVAKYDDTASYDDLRAAFDRWIASRDDQVRAEALRKAGSWYWTHAEETMRQTVPQGDHYVSVSQWLVDEADRIEAE